MQEIMAAIIPHKIITLITSLEIRYFSLEESHCNNKPINKKPIGR